MKLLERRECWKLTWPGRLIVAGLLIGGLAIAAPRLNDFLSINAPVDGEYLIVEGWMPAFAYREAARLFKGGSYKKIIAASVLDEDWDAGGDLRERSGAEKLVALGVPPENVVTATASPALRDRTFHAAMAVHEWLARSGISATSIDVMTIGPHARRSRLLYEEALGHAIGVGVIPIEDRRYDAKSWWRSSAGVRTVTGELIAYLYARLLFTPN